MSGSAGEKIEITDSQRSVPGRCRSSKRYCVVQINYSCTTFSLLPYLIQAFSFVRKYCASIEIQVHHCLLCLAMPHVAVVVNAV